MTTSATSRSASNGTCKLNVIFHGLWAWEATNNGRLLAHTPIEPHGEHIFRAGHPAQPHDNVIELKASDSPFVLTNVTAGTKTDFDLARNVWVHQKPFQHADKRFCVVDMPPALDIIACRTISPVTHPAFAGTHGDTLKPEGVSMVQVFVYEVSDVTEVTLGSITPPIQVQPDGRTANLHFYAQPRGGHHTGHHGAPNPNHAAQAYKAMAQMFDLDITPISELFVKPSEPTGVEGVTAADLLLLGETDHSTTIGLLGPSGSNCDGLVVDNR